VHVVHDASATPSVDDPVSTVSRNGEPPIVNVPVKKGPQPDSSTPLTLGAESGIASAAGVAAPPPHAPSRTRQVTARTHA
jgi:hypothetical protein